MSVSIAIVVAGIAAMIATSWARKWATREGVADVPRRRHVLARVVPRLGSEAGVAGLFVPLLRKTVRASIDFVLLAAAFGLSFALRFDWSVPDDMLARMLLLMPYVVSLQYATLAFSRAPRVSWRFFSLRDTKPFALALGWSGAVLVTLRYSLPALFGDLEFANYLVVPFSIIVLDWGIALALTVGARVLRRAASEDAETHFRRTHSAPPPKTVRTLLIGAGQAGVTTANELRRRPELGFVPIGFVDDDLSRRGMMVCGLHILGSPAELSDIASQSKADEALICISNARGPDIRRLTAACEAASLRVRIVPGIHEIVGGTVNVSAIRDVAIEDLLGRAPVKLDESQLFQAFERSCVLVTGAGGSIGSELCRQVARFRPARLLLVDSSENNLFNIHRELAASFQHIELIPLIGNVTHVARMREIFERHRPAIILHAAAYKHVPMMEMNPAQAVTNNSLGTRIVADLADQFGAREFVLVSTDKAVRPTSIMGASKRAAEIYVQSLSTRSNTHFMTVRFGNVLGSAGSVVPIFKEQIARGGPVTITDPRMTRYFMTIPEACQLILQAAQLGRGGEIFMLDMGEPVRILDLARDLISLSGFVPEADIEIVVSGIRPGEKLHEELWSSADGTTSTAHPSIFVGTSPARAYDEVLAWFTRLEATKERLGFESTRRLLAELLPESDLLGEGPHSTLVAEAHASREVPAMPLASIVTSPVT